MRMDNTVTTNTGVPLFLVDAYCFSPVLLSYRVMLFNTQLCPAVRFAASKLTSL